MDRHDCFLVRLLLLPFYFLLLLIPAIISKPVALIPIVIGGILIYLITKLIR